MNPTVNPVNSSGPANRPDYAGGARNGELVRDNVRGGFAWIEKSGFNGTNFGRIKGTRQHAARELEGALRFTFQLFLKSICRRRLFSGSLWTSTRFKKTISQRLKPALIMRTLAAQLKPCPFKTGPIQSFLGVSRTAPVLFRQFGLHSALLLCLLPIWPKFIAKTGP